MHHLQELTAEGHADAAQQALQCDDFKKAIHHFRRAADLEPEVALGLHMIAIVTIAQVHLSSPLIPIGKVVSRDRSTWIAWALCWRRPASRMKPSRCCRRPQACSPTEALPSTCTHPLLSHGPSPSGAIMLIYPLVL